MYKTKMGILITTLAVLAIVTLGSNNSWAQTGTTPVTDTMKTGYAPNANQAGANQVNVTDPFIGTGSQSEIICADFFVFDQNEQLEECCGCPVSQNGLLTMLVDSGHPGDGNPANSFTSQVSDLVSNPFLGTGSPPAALSFANIKIISAELNQDPNTRGFPGAQLMCDATAGRFPEGQYPFGVSSGSQPFKALSLTPSLRAWGTHFQNQTNVTESEYRNAPLSQTDVNNYTNWCAAIQQAGTGLGVCSCGNNNGV